MTEPTNGHRALIEALRDDAGDYAVHMRGAPMSHELSWDARDVRAWRAADALEAAAGVAPQAPPRINRDKLVAVIDAEAGSYEPVTSGCGYHASLKLADGSDMAERIADKVIRAAIVSVQPSSTVDEGKLAEVLHLANHDGCQSVTPTQAERHAAKAIADHLRGASL